MLWTSARPKSISGRTSYHPSRLEFHRYPHLIPECRTARGFGPPSTFRWTSSWAWIDRRVSGLVDATNALFRLAFTMASPPQGLNRATSSKLVGSFFNRNAVTDLRPLQLSCKRTVSDTVSSPSRATFKLSLTVLVHYRSVSVFSLGTSSCLLPAGFLGPRRTMDHTQDETSSFVYRAITVFGPAFHRVQLESSSFLAALGSSMFVSLQPPYDESPSSPSCPR